MTNFILAVVAVICVGLGLTLGMLPLVGDYISWIFYVVALIAGLFIFFPQLRGYGGGRRRGRRRGGYGDDGGDFGDFLDDIGDFGDD